MDPTHCIKKKKRYQQNGFDLDLTYVTPRCIAMGYPASGSSGLFRNPANEVARFLKGHHGENYWVFNLCAEISYNPGLFDDHVSLYPFNDHAPPMLVEVARFCEEVAKWMEKDPKNVIAIHCKAGKGRTGVMLCAYLLWAREYTKAEEAMAFYGVARTENGRGITIPSQQRFVRYFESLVTYHNDMDAKRLNSNSPNGFERPMYSDATAVELLRSSMLTAKSNTNDGPDDTDIYEEDNEEDNEEETDINDEEEGPITEDKVRACITKGRQACESAMKQQDFLPVLYNGVALCFPPVYPVELKFIELSSTPSLSQIGGTFRPSFTISCRGAAGENINYQSHDIIAAGTYRKGSQPIHFNLPSCAVLNEVCIEFFHRGRTKRKRMFEFWVHTSYLPKKGLLVLGKNELDNAVKDTKNLTFPVNFVVRVGFEPMQ